MGKTRPKKHRADQPEPTGLINSQAMDEIVFEMGDNTMPVGSTVSSVVEELQSDTPEQRECACNTIANLVSSSEARGQFVSAEAVRAIGPLLIDASFTVRRSALGALRNLSVEGGVEICETMVQQDCMTPLVMMLQKMCVTDNKELPSFTSDEIQVLTQALHLLLNLCESSEAAVKIFNAQQLLSLCLKFLVPDPEPTDDPLYIAAARCLYTVSDSNLEIVGSTAQSEVVLSLSAILGSLAAQNLDTYSSLFQMLLIGVLQNINGGQLSGFPSELVSRIIQILGEVLSMNIHEELQAVIGMLSPDATTVTNGATVETTEPNANGETTDSTELNGELDKRLEDVQRRLSAQKVALEVLTNLCCVDDDDEAWEDEEGSDTSSDEVSSVPEDVGMDTECSSAAQDMPSLPTDMTNLLIASGILQKVVEKTNLPGDAVCQSLQGHSKTARLWAMLSAGQSHALLCVSNLLGVMGRGVTVDSTLLLTTWSHLAQLSRNPQVVKDDGRLEDVTGALRAVVQKLCHDRAPQLLEVTDTDIQFLSDLSLNSHPDGVRANAMGIASAIGCSLVKQGHPTHALMKPLGQLLCEVCRRDAQLHVVAEALDAIFDVFAEDETDPIASDINLVGTLMQLSPVLKSRVKQLKGKLGEHHGIITTARTNLMRFIKYKAQRLS